MTNGKAMQQQRLQMVRDATAKVLPATTDLQLGGQSVKVSDLLTSLDGALSTFAPVDAAKAALKQTQSDRTQKVAAAHEQVAQLKAYLIATWGKGSPQLAPFGFTPKARTSLTSEQLALKAAKAKLTRTARGTKGSKQKLGITVQGQPGLVLMAADGTPMPGVLKGPSAPALTPATTQPAQAAAPVASGSPTSGTPNGK
jgi:hypothetical protein